MDGKLLLDGEKKRQSDAKIKGRRCKGEPTYKSEKRTGLAPLLLFIGSNFGGHRTVRVTMTIYSIGLILLDFTSFDCWLNPVQKTALENINF